jgi:hypothetical protein
MNFDPVTESVAHFIGYFHIKIEEVRLRDQYNEFRALEAAAQQHPELPGANIETLAPYDFVEFDPGVVFLSLADPPYPAKSGPLGEAPLFIKSIGMFIPSSRPWMEAPMDHAAQQIPGGLKYLLKPPGSAAVVVSQYNSLHDDDFMTMVKHEVAYHSPAAANVALDALFAASNLLEPVAIGDHPSGEAQIGEAIWSTYSQIESFQPASMQDLTSFAAHGNDTLGIYINGLPADAMPKLSDYILPKETAPVDTTSTTHVEGQGLVTVDVSTTFDAGSNTLINEVHIGSSWTISPVIAVVGDYVNIDVISQINVLQDIDSIGAEFATWSMTGNEANLALNIASFTQQAAATEADANASLAFPTTWNVTTITGNLIFLNWVQQLNFVTDNDVGILNNSGSTSLIEMGGNVAVSSLSLAALGQYYDLIIIGGQLYSADIILQKNILLDNDFISSENGVTTSGTGSLSTNGNLLWNQAGIHTTGNINVDALPAEYLQAALALANGDESQIGNLLDNPEFAGLTGLNVLYITGNLFDLQYISQTNILGDSDQVILAAEAAESSLEGNWSVVTGSNAIANLASISSEGPDATIYVGGTTYSDALLYQAELVSSDPNLGLTDPNALASEAVVFLAEGMLDPAHSDVGVAAIADTTGGSHADVMQTVTG